MKLWRRSIIASSTLVGGLLGLAPHMLRSEENAVSPWVVEQMPGGEVKVSDAGLEIMDRDGMSIFTWKDPAALTEGWFAFRTVHSHQRIRNFQVESGTTR